MKPMPIHSLAERRSSKIAIDDSSAMTGMASMLSDAVPAERKRRTPIHSTKPNPDASAPVHSSKPTKAALHCVSGRGSTNGRRQSGRIPSSICHVMKLSMSKPRSRWKYFIAIVPHAQPNPESTAHALAFNSPSQCHGSTTSVSPASANAIATHCMPRTRSPRTGQARRIVQKGIVNTRTAARPAPPSATAIVVEPMLTVVWKKPVTATAAQDSGSSGRRRITRTANSAAMATHVRSMLKMIGCARLSASFIATQLVPQSTVSTTSAM